MNKENQNFQKEKQQDPYKVVRELGGTIINIRPESTLLINPLEIPEQEIKMEDSIHDCYVNVVGSTPNEEQIKTIYNQLPSHIKHLADEWGWNDTEVNDGIFIWIQNNLDKI